jgi:hypothetical protein
MKNLLALCLLCLACTASTCASSPQPVPPAPPADYSAICAHLSDIGCPEGAAPNCASAFRHIAVGNMADLHPQCLLDATTRAQARACGSVDCP